MKRALKRILYIVIGLAGFILLVAGFTQTPMFRDRLRATVVSQLDSLLEAKTKSGGIKAELHGDYYKGNGATAMGDGQAGNRRIADSARGRSMAAPLLARSSPTALPVSTCSSCSRA